MEFLSQQNQLIMNEEVAPEAIISAKDKQVLVIGGGDTGSDCVGTSIRQGAVKVTQIEILPQPPVDKNPDTPWPYYPNILKNSPRASLFPVEDRLRPCPVPWGSP